MIGNFIITIYSACSQVISHFEFIQQIFCNQIFGALPTYYAFYPAAAGNNVYVSINNMYYGSATLIAFDDLSIFVRRIV